MAVEFSERLPDQVPESLPVYRFHRPEAYPASAAKLAKVAGQIGLSGRAHEVSTADDWTKHHEGSFELGVHRESGALFGRDRERYARHGERPFGFDDDEAHGIARRFLERTELIPVDQTRLERVTHLRTAGRGIGEAAAQRAAEEGEGEERVLDAGALYRRVMEGGQVHGPGGFAMVHVDPDGEVAGFRMVWRGVAQTVGDVRIRPSDEAYQRIEELAKQVRGDVQVTKASFGYFEQGVSDRQRFLQPAYAMVYVVRDEEVAFKSASVVPAGEKVFEPLMGEKRFPMPPQEPRSAAAPRKDRIG